MGLYTSRFKKQLTQQPTQPRLIETASGGMVIDEQGKTIREYQGYLPQEQKQYNISNPDNVQGFGTGDILRPSTAFPQATQGSVGTIDDLSEDKIREEFEKRGYAVAYDQELGKKRYFVKNSTVDIQGKTWDEMNSYEKFATSASLSEQYGRSLAGNAALGGASMISKGVGFYGRMLDKLSGSEAILDKLGVDKTVSQEILDFAQKIDEYREKEFDTFSYQPEDITIKNIPSLLTNPEFILNGMVNTVTTGVLATLGGVPALLGVEGGDLLSERRQRVLLSGAKEETTADILFSAGMGLFNAWIENLSFKVMSGKVAVPLSEKVLNKISNRVARNVASWGTKVATEMGEEFIQEGLPVLVAEAIFRERGSLSDAFKDAVKSGTTASIMAIPGAGILSAFGVSAENRQRTAQDFLDKLTPEQKMAIENIEAMKNRYENNLKTGEAGQLVNSGEKIAEIYRTLAVDDLIMLQKNESDPDIGSKYKIIKDGKLNNAIIEGRMQDVSQKLAKFGRDGRALALFVKAGVESQTFDNYQKFTDTVKTLLEQGLPPQEAKKFESAYLSSLEEVYHGEGGKAQAIAKMAGAKAKFGEGYYITKDAGVAEDFAGSKDGVIKKYLKPGTKLLILENEEAYSSLRNKLVKEALSNRIKYDNEGDLIKQYALKNGYVGVNQLFDATELHGQDPHAGIAIYDQSALIEPSQSVKNRAEKQKNDIKKEGEIIKKTEGLKQTRDKMKEQLKTSMSVVEKTGVIRTVPEKDLKYLFQEAINQGVGEELATAITKPLSEQQIARMSDSQKALMATSLDSISVAEGLNSGVILENIQSLGQTPTLKPETVVDNEKNQATVQKVKQTADVIPKQSVIESVSNKINEIEAEPENLRKQDVASVRESLRLKIDKLLSKDATTFVDVAGGKNKASIFKLSVKKLPNGKYGYAITFNLPNQSQIINYVPKFSSKERAVKMGVQKAIRLIESARLAGLPTSILSKIKEALQATNGKLGVKGVTKKKAAKIIKETQNEVLKKKSIPKKQKTPKTKSQLTDIRKSASVDRGTDVEIVKGIKTYYKKEGNEYVIRDEDTDLVYSRADSLKTAIKQAKYAIDNLTTVQIRQRVPQSSGQYSSSVAQAIGEFEILPIAETTKGGDDFKLGDKVLGLIRKYGKRIGEGYLKPSQLGVFKERGRMIRLRGITSLSTAIHEIAHLLDISEVGLTNRIITEMGRNNALRNQLKDIYLKYYPGAKKYHKLRKKLVEGFAVFIQKYASSPNEMETYYPDLVEAILFDKDSSIYHPIFNELVFDVRDIIRDYQSLPPLKKTGSRISYDEQREVEAKVLTKEEKARSIATDFIYPLEVMAKKAKNWMTNRDISLWVRASQRTARAIIANNIEGLNLGEKGYHRFIGDNIVVTLDFTWDDLLKKVATPYETNLLKLGWDFKTYKENRLKNENNIQDFDSFLVDREKYFEFKEKENIEKEIGLLKEKIANIKKENGNDSLITAGLNALISLLNDKKIELADLNQKITNDEITQAEATAGYISGKDRFKEEARMFDSLTKEDLFFAIDAGLISRKSGEEMLAREGYAPLKRINYDEILGEEGQSLPKKVFAGGKTSVSSFFRRKGSSKEIISPTISGVRNHIEITRKGFIQMTYNQAVDLSEKLPEFFERLELKTFQDVSGRIIYPQEKDPNIIMARVDGKRIPILVNRELKNVFDMAFTPQNIGATGVFLTTSARYFTKGTTALYQQFGAIINPVLDQLTLSAQSRYKAVPFISSIKVLRERLADDNSQEAVFFREFLMWGGQMMTLTHSADQTANEWIESMQGEANAVRLLAKSVGRGVENLTDTLSFLATKSEVLTRSYEYIMSRKAGDPPIVALEKAARVTASFHHVGSLGGKDVQTLVRSIPFLNPAIQVAAQAYSTIKESPETRKKFGLVVASVMATQAASLGVLLAFGSPEDKRKYLGIQPEELSKYLFIPKPGGGLIKIRLSETLSTPGTVLNMIIADAFLKAEYSAKDYYTASTAFIPKQFNLPRIFFKEGGKEWLTSIIPQIIKTPLLVGYNLKDYPTLSPLVSQKLSRLEPSKQFTESTSRLSVFLGEKFGFSPIKADALLTGFFGRSIGYLTAKPSAYNLASPFIFREYFYSTRQVQDYYSIKEKNDPIYNTYNKLKKSGAEGEKEIAVNSEKYQKAVKINSRLNAVEAALKEFNEIDEEKEPLKAEAKRREIFMLIDKLKSND